MSDFQKVTFNLLWRNVAAVLVILFQSLATRLADKYVLSLVKKLCTCSPENLLDNYLTSAFTGIIKGIGETKTTKMIGNLDVGIKKLLPGHFLIVENKSGPISWIHILQKPTTPWSDLPHTHQTNMPVNLIVCVALIEVDTKTIHVLSMFLKPLAA